MRADQRTLNNGKDEEVLSGLQLQKRLAPFSRNRPFGIFIPEEAYIAATYIRHLLAKRYERHATLVALSMVSENQGDAHPLFNHI